MYQFAMSEPSTIAAAPPWRFSIRSLLIVVTVVCVLLAPYHWLGFGYLFALLCSMCLIGLSIRTYQATGIGLPILISVFGAGVGFAIAIGSLALLLCSLANFTGCVVSAPFKLRTSRFAIILFLVGLVPYALMLNIGMGIRERSAELIEKYPAQSVEQRLEFELAHQDSSELKLTAAPEAQLTYSEHKATKHNWRVASLRRLHDETYQRFTIAAGFGPLRMAEVSDYFVNTDPRSDTSVPLNLKSKEATGSLASYLEGIHESTRFDLFDLERIGFVRSVNHVVGFEPHGPSDLTSWIGADKGEESNWQLTRLELVGLLKHDEPRVYIAETIPLMNELDSLPHRQLNEFEAQALPQLATEKDTVIEEFVGGAKMLGAVRAGNDCLQCHNGPRGKLLGAFSYEFKEIQ